MTSVTCIVASFGSGGTEGRKEIRKGGRLSISFLSCTPLRRRAGTQLMSCTMAHGMRWEVRRTLVCSARATLDELSVGVV